VRRFGAVKMFKLGLLVQLAMGLWLLAVSAVGLGFWALVIGVAVYLGCIAMISSNAMAVILDDFPHMAGTASSLAGTLRFSIGALVGAVLSMAPGKSAWPMVTSMALCSIVAVLFYVYASRPRDRAA
jgi:DHA1 family bicyclomycin/chloramphenicol resistance-like MFS transporter